MRARTFTSALALLLLCAPLAANAEDEPIDEIRVTAQKREQSIYEVSATLSVLTPEEMAARGIRDLVDVGKVVPNLTVVTFGGGSLASIGAFIRGIGSQDHLILTDPSVGVYLDDVYLGRQIAQNWNLADIDHIEVVRGPQGVLWGRNAIGGSVNIVTRKPDAAPRAHMTLEAGSRERVNLQASGNAALAEDWFASGSATLQRRGGVGEFHNLPGVGKEVGEQRDASGRVSLLWKASEHAELLLSADGNHGRHGLNPYTTRFLSDLVVGGEALADLISRDPYDNNTGARALAITDNHSYGVSATLDIARGEDAQQVRASHRRLRYDAGLDDDALVLDYLMFGEIGVAEQTTVEARWSGERDVFDFVGGLYWFRENGHNVQPNLTFKGVTGNYFFVQQETDSAALYGSVGWFVRERLHLSVGARFTRDEKDGRALLINHQPTTEARAHTTRTWREWNWMLAANWRLTPRMTLYGTVASGYQSGASPARPYCLFTDPECLRAGDSITAVNYEAGFRGAWSERASTNLAVFRTDYTNLPYPIGNTGAGGFDTTNLILEQRSVGVEWEGRVRLGKAFTLQTSFGYIHAEVRNTPDPLVAAPYTPAYNFALSPEWSARTAGGGTLTLRADYSWRDDMLGEPSRDATRGTLLRSRGLLNFYLGYRSPQERFEIGAYGHNVTDERYPHAALNTGDYVLTILSNDASEFGVRLTWHFASP